MRRAGMNSFPAHANKNAPQEACFVQGADSHLEAEVGIEPAYADLQSAA